MVTLDMEHVLILVIVAFVLYHFVGRCQCNGFRVGGQIIPQIIPKDEINSQDSISNLQDLCKEVVTCSDCGQFAYDPCSETGKIGPKCLSWSVPVRDYDGNTTYQPCHYDWNANQCILRSRPLSVSSAQESEH